MVNFYNTHQIHRLILIAYLFCAQNFWADAQQLPLCQGGEILAHSCGTACILCDLNGYSNSTIQVTPGSPPPGFCTQIVHNIGWVGFIAGSEDLTFDVEVFPCTLGNSIEMGIYEAPDCMNSVLVGTCNTAMFQNNTYSFNNNVPLNPGCVYFLVFDNNGPAECPFTVTVTSGSATAPNPGPTPTPEGPAEVCPGAVATYSIPPVFGTCEYKWTAPPGALINGSPSPVSIQGEEGASVEISFGNNAGNVCVETGNVCAGYSESCLPVTMATIPPTVLPAVSICNGTTYEWVDGDGAFYGSTQLMSTTFQSWLGCDSIVQQQLVVRPPIVTNLGTLISCSNECVVVGGTSFCDAGVHQVHLTSYLDCDSTVVFALNQIQVNAVVASPDTIDCLHSSVLLDGTASTSNATYAWYNSQNVLLGNNNTLNVSNPGTYVLVVERTVGMHTCRDSAWATVMANQQLPMALAEGDTLNCQGDSLQLNGTSNLPGAIFAWAGPGIDSTNQNLEDPWLDVPGTYVLTVTNPANGCTAKDTTMVESMGMTPDLNVPVGDTLDCANPIVWFVAQSITPGVVISWMAPDSTLTLSDSVQADQNGLWIALATAPGGCTLMDTSLLLLDTMLPAAMATGGMLDCSGTPIPIHGSSPDSSATFSWTGPGNFSANIPDTTVTISGNYLLTVSAPNGCTATATATVLANTNVPDLTAGGWDTLTCVQISVTVSANSISPGAVITWSGTGNFSPSGNSAQITSPGLFTVTATTPNGCQSSINFSVPIDTAAPLVTVQGDTIDCNNPLGYIIGYCATPFIQYNWSGPGVLAPTLPETHVNLSGIYILQVTDPATGCTASAQTIVQVDNVKPQLSAAQPSTLTCADTSSLLWASSLDNGVVFLWSGPNGLTDSNDTILVNLPGIYSVVATGLNGCGDSLSITVPVDTISPDLTASGGMINCAQNSVQLIGQTNTAGVSFLWSGPNGFSSTNQSPTTTEAGTFQLTGTAPNGCNTVTLAQVIADFTVPVMTLSSTLQTLNCTDTQATLQAQSSLPGTGFQWTLSGVQMGNNSSLTTSLPGTYVVSGTASNGCMAADSIVIQQDITPPNVFALGDTLFCNSQSVTISGGSSTPGTTLLWSGPGNFSSTQTMPSVSVPGNYTLTVTAPNGCTATATATVIPDATAPDVSVQPATTLTCAITTTPLMAISGTSGVVYNWSGPGNFSATGPSAQTQTAGLYTVVVTAPNGCTNVQTITVGIDTIAPVATAGSDTLTCANPIVTLSGNSNTNGVIYNWSGPGNFTASQPDAPTDQPGLYLLTLTAPNGCTGIAGTQVLQDTMAPDIVLNGSVLLTCAQTSTALSANSASSGISWLWTGPGNFSASVPDITVDQPGNYTATATAPNGCTADAVIMVTQNIVPPTASATGGTINCISPTITLSGQSTDPGATFTWTGPGNFTANGPMSAASLAGTYTLTVTGVNGCTSTATTMVTADQVSPVFALIGDTISCSSPSITAGATGFSNGTTFQWSGPGGFQGSGASVTISMQGVYQVTAQGANGCSASQSIVIPADLAAPQITLQGGDLNCRDTVVQILADVSPAGAALSWSGPQQNLPATTGILVELPGLYTLTATSANGCTAESDILVDEIIPTWSIDLGPDQTVWEGSFVSIHAITDLQNKDVANITWTPSFSCSHCLDQVFKAKDSVFLLIAVEDKNGCVKTDDLQVNVRKRGSIYVPNIFSPDGDGYNDVFQVFASNPMTLMRSFRIFDRWGNMVFSQENFRPDELTGTWNGTFRGSLMQPAVFVWMLEVEYEDGTTELLSGDVLLKL